MSDGSKVKYWEVLRAYKYHMEAYLRKYKYEKKNSQTEMQKMIHGGFEYLDLAVPDHFQNHKVVILGHTHIDLIKGYNWSTKYMKYQECPKVVKDQQCERIYANSGGWTDQVITDNFVDVYIKGRQRTVILSEVVYDGKTEKCEIKDDIHHYTVTV